MSDLSEDPQLIASKRGLDLVLPGPKELQIDLDYIGDERVMHAAIETLQNNGVGCEISKITESPGGNKHAYVTLFIDRPLTELERVCLQACLGSDRQRETLSFLRLWFNIPRPASCFFEKKTATTPDPTEDLFF